MWRSESGVEPAATSPSPFWEILALLGREPGMEWLLRSPNGCTGWLGSSGQEPGGGDGVGRCSAEGVVLGGPAWCGRVKWQVGMFFLWALTPV